MVLRFASILLSLVFCLQAYEPTRVSLRDLDSSYVGQEVVIRGFLYGTEDGKVFLATEPNLKTCCVGKSNCQVQVLGDLQSASFGVAVNLRGCFYIDGGRRCLQVEK